MAWTPHKTFLPSWFSNVISSITLFPQTPIFGWSCECRQFEYCYIIIAITLAWLAGSHYHMRFSHKVFENRVVKYLFIIQFAFAQICVSDRFSSQGLRIPSTELVYFCHRQHRYLLSSAPMMSRLFRRIYQTPPRPHRVFSRPPRTRFVAGQIGRRCAGGPTLLSHKPVMSLSNPPMTIDWSIIGNEDKLT